MTWDLFWLWLDRVGMVLGVMTGATWLGGLTLAVLRPEVLRRWFSRNRFPKVGGGGEQADALVFTVSRADVPAWVMRQLRPQAVGFIATEQSRALADELRQAAERQGIRALAPVCIANPDDPAECRARTTELLVELADCGVLAVDVTGGKTPMSLGAFMAAEECGAKTLYVTCEYEKNQPDMRTAAITCISKPA
jgi:hypothetical protein